MMLQEQRHVTQTQPDIEKLQDSIKNSVSQKRLLELQERFDEVEDQTAKFKSKINELLEFKKEASQRLDEGGKRSRRSTVNRSKAALS